MILFVCTGNICRSAMGEILFRHYSRKVGIDVETASSGILGWDGAPITQSAREVLSAAGIDDLSHSSKMVSKAEVGRASLILPMTRDHAHGILARDSGVKNHTFLAGELLRLLKRHPFLSEDETWLSWIRRLDQIRFESHTPGLGTAPERGSAAAPETAPEQGPAPAPAIGSKRGSLASSIAGSGRTIIGFARDEIVDPPIGDLQAHQKAFDVLDELTSLLVENIERSFNT